jgi:transposase
MGRKRRSWTAEEKLEILSEARIDSVPVSEVCRRHGITSGQFYAWEKKARIGSLEALRGHTGQLADREITELHERLGELRAVVSELITENLKLKKGRWP